MCSCMNEVAHLREQRGLSQGELATLAGISQAQLSRIEAGLIDRPSFETVRKLAAALRTRPEKLFPAPDGASA